MADVPDLAEAWRRATAANLRYYDAWTRLAATWLQELRTVGEDLADSPSSRMGTWLTAPTATWAPRPAGSSPETVTTPTSAAALVLEAEGGGIAAGAFLVENHLGHPVEAVVSVDPFPGDGVGDLQVTFEPPRLDLGIDESAVVKVSATVPGDLPGGEHQTTIRVPDLAGTAVRLVVRRLEPAG